MRVGDSFVDPGFVSTSLSSSYAFFSHAVRNRREGAAALSMIHVPPAVGGVYASGFDEDQAEVEFVIARGTTFTLRDRRAIRNAARGWRDTPITLSVFAAS